VQVITQEMVEAEIERLSAELTAKGAEIPAPPGALALPRGEWEAVSSAAPDGYARRDAG
jgi:hypothetical protein